MRLACEFFFRYRFIMSENNTLNHFRNYRGYALLGVFLSLGLTLLSFVIIGLLQQLGVTGIQSASPFILLGALFMAAHLSVGRFINIEGRRPHIYDTNSIALSSALILILSVFIIFLLTVLIGGGMSSDFSKFFKKEFLGYFGAGTLGFILIFQILLYLCFAVFSRFRQTPKTS